MDSHFARTSDHIGDAAATAKAAGRRSWRSGDHDLAAVEGCDNVEPMNKGGTIDVRACG
jgi:hypothetical protein